MLGFHSLSGRTSVPPTSWTHLRGLNSVDSLVHCAHSSVLSCVAHRAPPSLLHSPAVFLNLLASSSTFLILLQPCSILLVAIPACFSDAACVLVIVWCSVLDAPPQFRGSSSRQTKTIAKQRATTPDLKRLLHFDSKSCF